MNRGEVLVVYYHLLECLLSGSNAANSREHAPQHGVFVTDMRETNFVVRTSVTVLILGPTPLKYVVCDESQFFLPGEKAKKQTGESLPGARL
jgi:hypothetical protein